MTQLPFIKMHGLGNDFVVLDARQSDLDLTPEVIRSISDRRTGVGCDQFIVMENPRDDLADVFMRIRNADGAEVGACGNATRCIADHVMRETSSDHVVVETVAGLLDSTLSENGMVSVDMGPAKLDWREIPLSEACDTSAIPMTVGPLAGPVGVNVGNPHAVFFVDDAEAIDLAHWGPLIEKHGMFPEHTNVEVVQVMGPGKLRMRVWERGVGITNACGTGACAALVAAARTNRALRKADVILDGGPLTIEWLRDNHVLMTGPVARPFRGEIDLSTLAR